jgi:iron complex transport system permease protein
MRVSADSLIRRLLIVLLFLLLLFSAVLLLAISSGSGGEGLWHSLSVVLGQGAPDAAMETIIWRIRLPRALLAALAGGALSLGGLVFQALLRNPLAEPYILGVSGGSAIGAILGILLGLSRFPGVSACAFRRQPGDPGAHRGHVRRPLRAEKTMRSCSQGSW